MRCDICHKKYENNEPNFGEIKASFIVKYDGNTLFLCKFHLDELMKQSSYPYKYTNITIQALTPKSLAEEIKSKLNKEFEYEEKFIKIINADIDEILTIGYDFDEEQEHIIIMQFDSIEDNITFEHLYDKSNDYILQVDEFISIYKELIEMRKKNPYIRQK
ncbi:MAG: hypothetical protein ACTSRP_07405 [Candidatus Helarchaeota archaeon]